MRSPRCSHLLRSRRRRTLHMYERSPFASPSCHSPPAEVSHSMLSCSSLQPGVVACQRLHIKFRIAVRAFHLLKTAVKFYRTAAARAFVFLQCWHSILLLAFCIGCEAVFHGCTSAASRARSGVIGDVRPKSLDTAAFLFLAGPFAKKLLPVALVKGSPHSGQNFGGCAGSSGSQPHLSQR